MRTLPIWDPWFKFWIKHCMKPFKTMETSAISIFATGKHIHIFHLTKITIYFQFQMVFVGLQKGVCILWYIFGLGNHMGFQTCYIKSLLPVCGYGFSRKLQRHYSWQKNGFHGYYKILQRNGWKAWWQGYLIYCQRTCSSTSNYYCWSISFKSRKFIWKLMLLRSFLVIEDEKDTTYRTRYIFRTVPTDKFHD